VEVRSPAAAWIARPEAAEDIGAGRLDFLLAGPGIRATRSGAGRAPLAQVTLKDWDAVGKRSLHGGVLGSMLGGLYLGPGRVRAQIEAAARLERLGISTPQILAVGWRPRAVLFRSLAIVTRTIPRAQNLYEAAHDDAPWGRRRVILERSADLVRALHDAGFRHADLNVSNLVLGGGPEGDGVHVVDLDKGRFVGAMGISGRFAGLARLLRSCEKWLAGSTPLGPRDELLFLRRYCRADRALFRTLQERLQRYRARLRMKRLVWRLLRGRPSGHRAS
jgi:hypothetical protein